MCRLWLVRCVVGSLWFGVVRCCFLFVVCGCSLCVVCCWFVGCLLFVMCIVSLVVLRLLFLLLSVVCDCWSLFRLVVSGCSWVLLVVWCPSLFVVCYSPLRAVRCLMLVACSLLVVRCLLFVGCCYLLFVACCSLCVVGC